MATIDTKSIEKSSKLEEPATLATSKQIKHEDLLDNNGRKFDPCGTLHPIFSVGNLYLGLYIFDSYWLSTI